MSAPMASGFSDPCLRMWRAIAFWLRLVLPALAVMVTVPVEAFDVTPLPGLVRLAEPVPARTLAVPAPAARTLAVPAPAARTEVKVTRIYRRADFGTEPYSPDARHVADWVVDSSDNRGLSF